MFGTPTLLWRILHFAEYHEPPLYQWNEVYLERLEPAACTGQHVVMGFQHEVHNLNNQLHPILSKEDKDPEMLVEDDGWDEKCNTSGVSLA